MTTQSRGPDTPSATDAPSLEFLPSHLRAVPYVYARDPASTTPGDVSGGANCQLYAYAVLACFGLHVPPLHSSGLWADRDATHVVTEAQPMDLLLFDGGRKPDVEEGYAAHIGVHVGPDQVLHLCQEIGVPAVWSYADFASRTRYSRLVGIKRANTIGT